MSEGNDVKGKQTTLRRVSRNSFILSILNVICLFFSIELLESRKNGGERAALRGSGAQIVSLLKLSSR